MSTVLITGMSGVGKSAVLAELARRGFEAVDTDYEDWIRVVDGEPLWDESRIDGLLSAPRDRPLFVQGTVANQGHFYSRFDAVVLLSAPVNVILERLRARTSNNFGKSPGERSKILRDIVEVEPLLRAGATHELDATRTVSQVVDRLVEIASPTTMPANS